MKAELKTINRDREFELTIFINDPGSRDDIHYVLDEYIKYSENIDENLANYKVSLDPGYGALMYFVEIQTENGQITESDFFEGLEYDFDILSKVVIIIYNVTSWSKNNDTHLYSSELDIFGKYAAYYTCLNNVKYLQLYIDIVTSSDMDHEDNQRDHIDSLIQKHGFTKSLIKLLSNRVSTAAGQWGWEQVSGYKTSLLELFNEEPFLRKMFLDSAKLSSYADHACPYSGNFWFERIRNMSQYIEDNDEREEWLKNSEKEVIQIFGENAMG